MKMIIQTPHFKARKALLGFVMEKVGKLSMLSDRIVESRIFLKLDKSDSREDKVCEIKLLVLGKELFASSQSNTFEGAVLKAAEAVKHQLERWKGSTKSRIQAH